jgi:hypothetical protein
MRKWIEIGALLVILLVAAILRFTAIDWDEYNNYHPDERYIAWVAASVERPEDLATAFKPDKSTFNPFYWPAGATTEGILLEQDQPRRFAYGHLPLYLGVVTTRALETVGPSLSRVIPDEWLFTGDILNQSGLNDFNHITAAGRFLAALFDVATVGVIFLIGRLLYGSLVGLLAAAFLALNVMHIQLSHYFAVDPFLTFFVVLSIFFIILSLRRNHNARRQIVFVLLASAVVGLAIGSKFSAVLLLLPLSVAVLVNYKSPLRSRFLLLLAAIIIVFLAFALTNPFAILDWSCEYTSSAIGVGPFEIPRLNLGSCYLENVFLQATMVRGTRDVPFARQYIGTTPFFYFIEMQLRWGVGILLGLVAFIGFGWASWRSFSTLTRWWKERDRSLSLQKLNEVLESSPVAGLGPFTVSRAELVLLSWTIPFFVTTGVLMVKFMRYLQPLMPFLMVYGAAMLLSLPWKRWRKVIIVIVLIAAGIRALSFVNLYNQPHPWVAASQWIYENIESDSNLIGEVWDDPLPDTLEVDGVLRRRSEYSSEMVNWLTGTGDLDNRDKLDENLSLVSQADYVILSSNRNYGVIPRLEERYPLSSQYYQMLFDGRLGYEIEYAGTRTPNLFGIYLKPDSFSWPGLETPQPILDYFDSLPGISGGRFDESFTVYDQPLVIILKNTEKLSAAEMSELFAHS